MTFPTTLAACSLTPASNGPAGTDLPSELDDAMRQAFALIAQLRDGAGTPIGTIVPFYGLTAPAGWIKLNGALISRTTYAALFAFASSTVITSEANWPNYFGAFGAGDGSTTFRLPDLRAMFLRGLDESRGLDPARNPYQWQDVAVTLHNHAISDPQHAHSVYDAGHAHQGTTDTQGAHAHTYNQANNPVTVNAGVQANVWQTLAAVATSVDGAHAHNILTDTRLTGIAIYAAGTGISIVNAGSTDGHPRNLAYPFIMKY
jgi:microcystin-dependent protein